MQINVHHHGMELSTAGRWYAADRLHTALENVEPHVNRVRVYLADENGPRGGLDKSCTVAVWLRGGRELTVRQVGHNLVSVIDDAVERIRQAVARNIDRRRTQVRTARLINKLRHLTRLFRRRKDRES